MAQFPGGHSNLTYLVRHGDREYVLRRPPFGSKVKSAHDMGREFTVLTKLVAGLRPRAAGPRLRTDRRRARRAVLPDGAPARRGPAQGRCRPGWPTTCRGSAGSASTLVDALVDLHAVDYAAAGLGDFGKPVGYIERQVTGWSKRYADSQTDEIPAVNEAAAWLADPPAGRRSPPR